MCLGIPAKVMEIDGNTARVELGGIVRPVAIDLCPNVSVGDYVLIHTGFAIQKMDENEAKETLDLLREIAEAT